MSKSVFDEINGKVLWIMNSVVVEVLVIFLFKKFWLDTSGNKMCDFFGKDSEDIDIVCVKFY